MKYVKYLFIAIGLLVALLLIRLLVSRLVPVATAVITNVTITLQVVILLFTAGFIVAHFTGKFFFHKEIRVKHFVILFASLMVSAELLMVWLLYYPANIPRILSPAFSSYYAMFSCRWPQLDPHTGRYDSMTTYTLRPDTTFYAESFEFTSRYVTNRLGLRDTNASLDSPAIICLGDSYTMGLGVNQEQTYPDLLEKQLGQQVLNAGLVSFATAREMLMLQRLDLSGIQCLVVQYCQNDAVENKTYVASGYRLPVRTEKSYDSVSRSLQLSNAYYPFKHALTMLRVLGSSNLRNMSLLPGRSVSHTEQAKNFVATLESAGPALHHIPILVFDLNGRLHRDAGFTNALQQWLSTHNTPLQIHVLDLSDHLTDEHFYHLDVHLNAAGHQKVAALLTNAISEITTGNE